jgi:predicted hotdog family 3-hydroxylacyl-ACP dehydratase
MREDMDLDRLIPHRPPMRLVEEVAFIDETSIEVACTVRGTWPTVDHGHAQTLILVELIAQTAGALQGWRERHEKPIGEGGLLVGIPDARFAVPRIPVGTPLRCAVRVAHGAQSYLAFDGEVRDDHGKSWLTGSIQAFRPDNLDVLGVTP